MNTKDIDLRSFEEKTGYVSINDLSVGVVIKSARIRFGHLDLLVTPISGHGEKWMESHRVQVVA